MRISDWSSDVCSSDLFGRKGDRAVRQAGVVERLHPQPVAGEEQAAAAVVVNRKSEHAVEARQAIGAPLPPRRDNHFGIAAGAETVAAILQFGAQFAEIIDFAIIGQRYRLVVARHRLRRSEEHTSELQSLMRISI